MRFGRSRQQLKLELARLPGCTMVHQTQASTKSVVADEVMLRHQRLSAKMLVNERSAACPSCIKS